MEKWGQLCVIDLFDCNESFLRDEKKIRGFCFSLCERIGMKAVGDVVVKRFGKGELEGLSAMLFIETSSITVHADEVGRRVFVDIFSCKEFDSELAEKYCKEFFGVVRIKREDMRRG